jgi:hypothetical protein
MDLKWKKASCHIKLLFLTYLELRKNLSALEKWPYISHRLHTKKLGTCHVMSRAQGTVASKKL